MLLDYHIFWGYLTKHTETIGVLEPACVCVCVCVDFKNNNAISSRGVTRFKIYIYIYIYIYKETVNFCVE